MREDCIDHLTLGSIGYKIRLYWVADSAELLLNESSWVCVLLLNWGRGIYGEGLGASEGADEKRVEKNFSARITFAASEGWKASQNT